MIGWTWEKFVLNFLHYIEQEIANKAEYRVAINLFALIVTILLSITIHAFVRSYALKQVWCACFPDYIN